jgi:chorismate synthase
MNQFGNNFKVAIFGESHGPCVGITISGVPAGIPLVAEDFVTDMERRKGGLQKGTTPRQEADIPIFKSGLFNDKTTGAPLTFIFENNNTRSSDYDKQRAVPRPGHADMVAHQKYGGHEDYRGGGHFSGRLTACLVGAGVVAKKILTYNNLNKALAIQAKVTAIAGESDLDKGLQKGIDAKDSVGGIVTCIVENMPIGLGEPFFNSLESQLAHAAFSIPAVKGIEFGNGFAAANLFGAKNNDAIVDETGTTKTNHAGGIVGGISNGMPLIYSIAIKPTSSTPQLQETLNWETNSIEAFELRGRHDLCIALRVPPVLEATTAIVLVDAFMQINAIPRVV